MQGSTNLIDAKLAPASTAVVPSGIANSDDNKSLLESNLDSVFTFYFYMWITKKWTIDEIGKRVLMIDGVYPNAEYAVDIDLLNLMIEVNGIKTKVDYNYVDEKLALLPCTKDIPDHDSDDEGEEEAILDQVTKSGFRSRDGVEYDRKK